MIKLEAVIHPFKLEDAKEVLRELEVRDITISDVLDHGAASVTSYYRGASYRASVSRVKLEMLVSDERADQVVSALMRATRTTASGDRDGRILVYEVADAIRIHSGVHLQYTLP